MEPISFSEVVNYMCKSIDASLSVDKSAFNTYDDSCHTESTSAQRDNVFIVAGVDVIEVDTFGCQP